MPERAAKHFNELDSLRGLAAIAVVVDHAVLAISPGYVNNPGKFSPTIASAVTHSPLHVLWAGHEAVILFFVLSGFVLSLQWIKENSVSYPQFAFKRFCRIWIPYAAALAFSLAVRSVFNGHPLVGAPVVIYPPGELRAADVANLFGLVGYFNPGTVNGAFWSLVHEMRISLVFPLIMLLVAFLPWKRVLAGAFALSVIAGGCRRLTHPWILTDGWNTLHYAAFFVVGYLLAANLGAIRLNPKSGWVALFLGVWLYTYAWWFFPAYAFLHFPHMDDWVIATGAALLIVAALSCAPFSALLSRPLLVWLGRISYSLYLLHAPVIFAFLYALNGIVSPVWATVIAVPFALLLADLSYRWVERPAIALGKRWRSETEACSSPAAAVST